MIVVVHIKMYRSKVKTNDMEGYEIICMYNNYMVGYCTASHIIIKATNLVYYSSLRETRVTIQIITFMVVEAGSHL